MRRALAVGALFLATIALASPAAAKVPRGFFGVVPQTTLTGTDYGRMDGAVETLRLPIYWFECEPQRGHLDFAAVDREIGAAARHGIRALPFVYGTPGWVGTQQARAPLGRAAMARWRGFLRVLVRRYGPRGSFWRRRAEKLPIRRWQIWNEPNFRLFWAPRVEPSGYAKLLHASAVTIRHVDPGAKILLAGVAPVGAGMKTYVFMRRLLRVPGVVDDFDLAAVHPYSATVPELSFQVRKVREAMVAGGAGRKGLVVTEFGVASRGSFPSAFVEGEPGQASFLRQAYMRLLTMRRRWRIAGAYWFTWQDVARADPHCSFCQGAGLFTVGGRPKPAWRIFRRIAAGHGAA